MHGSFEEVDEAFLKNVTLWWGCAFTLAVYVAQVGSLGMIAIGLCYVVLARDGAMTSVTSAERMAPALCAGGILAEFLAGVAGYYAVAAVWPNFYYTPITAGKVTWLGLQAVCIAIYVVGVVCAYGGIKRALPTARRTSAHSSGATSECLEGSKTSGMTHRRTSRGRSAVPRPFTATKAIGSKR